MCVCVCVCVFFSCVPLQSADVVVSASPSAASPCVPTSSPLVKLLFFFPPLDDSCRFQPCAISWHVWCASSSFNWHLYGRGRGSSKEGDTGDRERPVDNRFYCVTDIRVITLFSLSLWSHFMGTLSIFQRISSRKTAITAVWENVINFSFFFPSCVSPRSFTSPFFSLPSLYLFSIFIIFLPFINYYVCFTGNDNNPAAIRRERELLMWNQNARHVPGHQKQAVLACSSASQDT